MIKTDMIIVISFLHLTTQFPTEKIKLILECC